jgi:hypothetical protein
MFTPVRFMSAKKKAALKEMAQDSLKNEQQESMTKRFAHVLDANLTPGSGELPEQTEASLEDARLMTTVRLHLPLFASPATRSASFFTAISSVIIFPPLLHT